MASHPIITIDLCLEEGRGSWSTSKYRAAILPFSERNAILVTYTGSCRTDASHRCHWIPADINFAPSKQVANARCLRVPPTGHRMLHQTYALIGKKSFFSVMNNHKLWWNSFSHLC